MTANNEQAGGDDTPKIDSSGEMTIMTIMTIWQEVAHGKGDVDSGRGQGPIQ